MTSAECLKWFEVQCEVHRRNLRIIVLVPNSDSCVYFVQEWHVDLQEWQEIGDGFCMRKALMKAAEVTP